MRNTRVAFLPKGEEGPLEPQSYRVLLMLPSVYRLWAKTRLRHLTPWVEDWRTEEMYAGVPGRGAADASYHTALVIENCTLKGEELTGGAADIYKRFDQIDRTLLYRLLEEAGMPKGVMNAYRNFLENLEVYNTVAGGLGQPYTKPASIPQGDPLSMMVVALLLRAWIIQMNRVGVEPRVLADDLLLMATGDRSLPLFEYAYNLTHKHLDDMGAKVAPKK